MKHLIRTAVALAALLSLVECNSLLGNEDEYKLVPPEAGARECLLNSQCIDDEVCIFRTCSPACLEDEDCARGSRCLRTSRGTACVTSNVARCSGDTCPEGSICFEGDCRNACADGGACLGDQICTPNAVCVGNDPSHDPLADAGTVDGGRDAGDAGRDAGPCVDAGAEDCFNNRDDDCDGDTDCADSQCSGPAHCVPEASGAVLGTLLAAGASCPTGYTARTLRRGLDAEVACNGCSCVIRQSRCDAGIYGYGSYTCGQFQFATPLYNTYSDRCSAVPAGANVHYYTLRATTDCTPAGTGTPPPASWGETGTYCAADRVGGGCAAGSRCVPRFTTKACSLRTGAATCGAGYPTSTTWYSAFTDTRTCTCLCATGFGSCSGYIEAFEGGACTGASTQLGAGAEGSACGLAFGLQSAIIRPSSIADTPCPTQFTGDGALTPTGAQTVCCR